MTVQDKTRAATTPGLGALSSTINFATRIPRWLNTDADSNPIICPAELKELYSSMQDARKIGKWSKTGFIIEAIVCFGVAIYIRYNGNLFGKLVGIGILFAGYFIGSLVDKRSKNE